MFIPGFWSEFGMCTEPSAFGARCIFPRNAFPYAERMITDEKQIMEIREPDPASDGLLPFVLNRLRWARPRIEDLGHKIRFSVSRGPFNIATFLMGMTEFLIALKTEPEAVHRLLRVITDFLKKWHRLQRETIPTIDGILILDDVVGLMGETDFMEFCFPYLKELYAPEAAVKFFHNDAPCAASIGHYADIGINVFNPGIQKTIDRAEAVVRQQADALCRHPAARRPGRGKPRRCFRRRAEPAGRNAGPIAADPVLRRRDAARCEYGKPACLHRRGARRSSTHTLTPECALVTG